MIPLGAEALDRTSFVPLYYQLQEVLKQHIESGGWRVGEALPSEPALARRFGVSRVVVRQALAILEDDRQIVRVRGRGTFVAEAKHHTPVNGLAGLLTSPPHATTSIQVLDVSRPTVERSVRGRLDTAAGAEVVRITTVVHLDDLPAAICYSYFRASDVAVLESRVRPGELIPPGTPIADDGVVLGRADISVEVSQCGQFEADRFDVVRRTPVFLVTCVQYMVDEAGERPFEVSRIEYRGDLVQLNLSVGAPEAGGTPFVASVRPGTTTAPPH
ncbi:GntR family transcriptional regulator [Actinomycetospora sp. C-140]